MASDVVCVCGGVDALDVVLLRLMVDLMVVWVTWYVVDRAVLVRAAGGDVVEGGRVGKWKERSVGCYVFGSSVAGGRSTRLQTRARVECYRKTRDFSDEPP